MDKLTVEECKQLLDKEVPDEQVEQLRDALYALVGQVLDKHFAVHEN